jgi:hypothetical protein
MSDSGEKKARNFVELGADMESATACDGSGYRILIPPYGGSNPPAPASDSLATSAAPELAPSLTGARFSKPGEPNSKPGAIKSKSGATKSKESGSESKFVFVPPVETFQWRKPGVHQKARRFGIRVY